MANKKNIILSASDVSWLEGVITGSQYTQTSKTRAKILIALSSSYRGFSPSGNEIAASFNVSIDTVSAIRVMYYENNGDIETIVLRKKRSTPPVPPKVTKEIEQRIINLREENKETGKTLSLRAVASIVNKEFGTNISAMTVHRTIERICC